MLLPGICFLLLSMTFCACREPAPENPLPDDEVLVSLICDLHEAEVAMNRIGAEDQDSIAKTIRLRIAATHKISPEKMDAWLEALQRSPEHAIVVYDSVIARLERQVGQ